MGVPALELVVKHTFLEYVESPTGNKGRLRAQTDSALFSGSSDGSVSESSSSSIGSPRPEAPTRPRGPVVVAPRVPHMGPSAQGAHVPRVVQPRTMVPPTPCQPACLLASQPGTVPLPAGPLTTVMLRNMPTEYNRWMLLDLINSEGFGGLYNFVYLPIDFNTRVGLGYCFVNFNTAEDAERFWWYFLDFNRWVVPSEKRCALSWSSPHQGLDSHIERYRNSPVMHASVPEECKPMVFMNGVQVPFPRPTKVIKAPRVRCRN